MAVLKPMIIICLSRELSLIDIDNKLCFNVIVDDDNDNFVRYTCYLKVIIDHINHGALLVQTLVLLLSCTYFYHLAKSMLLNIV